MHFAGAFDHCAAIEGGIESLTQAEDKVANQQALCASSIFEVASGLTGLAANGYIVSQACKKTPKAQRLFAGNAEDDSFTESGSTTTWALLAAIPIASMVSFFGGLRLAKSRKTHETRSIPRTSEQEGLMEMM